MSLNAHHLSFAYSPARPVFEGLDFELREGVTVVLGPNGAGKSTLVRLLLGSLAPDSGDMLLDGSPIARMSASARASRIAYVSQRPSVAGAFSVRDVVSLGRHALTPDERAVDGSIEALALEPFADRAFASLSVGEQQRASLARALAQLHRDDDQGAPRRVLLADEPTSAMDPRWVVRASEVIRSLPSRGIDALIVLHDFTLASRLADRVIVLDERGEVRTDGPPDTSLDPGLLERVFGTPFTRAETSDGPVILPLLGPGASGRGSA